jgi:biotin transport system substrate-specific component
MSLTTKAVAPAQQAPVASGVLAQSLWIAAFAVATAAGARLEIPHEPVPYTLQTFVVLLSGAFLGSRNGALSQLFYLAAGVLGAPVFAGGAFGFVRLLGPSGGYLLAFPAAAALVGYLLRERRTLPMTLLAMAAGLLVIFASGTAQLYAYYIHDGSLALSTGFLFFSWWDLLKLSAAAAIYHELARRWPRLP